MKNNNGFRLLPLGAAIISAFGYAHAQESDDIKALVTPSSFVSVGVGGVNNSDDAKRFGQYRGMTKGGAYGLFDIDFVNRNDDTGTWLILQGRDLGLDTRELSFTHQKQGDWKYTLDYNEMVRRDPYTIHTGLTGVGSTSLGVNLINKPAMPAAWATANTLGADNGVVGGDLELKIRRTALGISAEKWLSPQWQVEASFRTEERKGARLFGRAGLDSGDMGARPTNNGNNSGSWAVLLTPEPISSTTNIFEGRVSFNQDKLALTAGYFGSFFTNDYGSLTSSVPGTLNRGALWGPGGAAGAQSVAQLASAPIALPPDNQAHQLYASGTYAFSNSTRANFKVSYTHATQKESFAGMGLTAASSGLQSLDGEVNTILAQLGLTSRITKDLTINASLRYEDRDDQTPIRVYNTSTASNALNNTTNFASASQTRTTGKLEAVYRLPEGYTVVLGTDWEDKKVPTSIANTAITANQVYFRPEMEEAGVRAELRKSMSDTLNGSLGVEYKQRRGQGGWLTTRNAAGNPVTSVNPANTYAVLPDMYMDRDRTKARLSLDWSPLDNLDLQAIYERAQDNYRREFIATAANPFPPGANEVSVDSVTLDSSYAFSDKWKVNAYWTMSEYRWNVNKSSLAEDTKSKSQTIGLGLKGKLTSKLDFGADLMASWDDTSFTNQCISGTGTANTNGRCTNGAIAGWNGTGAVVSTAGSPPPMNGNSLPNIKYTTEWVKLFANYAVDKSSDVRLDVIYQHFKTDDWAWGYNGVPFLYSDNTTISQPMRQELLFVGARYIYKF